MTGKNGLKKTHLGKAEKWLVDEARKVGLDIEGFEHEITNEFVNHVRKNHGNEKTEAARGTVAIKEADFGKIAEIVMEPDFVIVGARRKNEDFMIYVKGMENGTVLYFEEVLRGRTNRSLRGKTMYKLKGNVSRESIINIVTNKGKTDISKAKIAVGTGGQSRGGAVKPSDPTVATSVIPDNLIDPQIAQM